MNKNAKTYKTLYYICFFLSFIGNFVFGATTGNGVFSGIYNVLIYLNLPFVLLFIFLMNKNYNLKKFNIICPITYLVFYGIVSCLCFVLNSFMLVPYVHFMYYYNFILVGYFMFNIYSLLCLSK